MRWRIAFLAVVVWVTANIDSVCADTVNGPYFGPEGAYVTVDTSNLISWSDARLAAQNVTPPGGYGEGHLLTVSNAAEQEWVEQNVLLHGARWIGFVSDGVTGNGFGEWHWIDDTLGVWQDPRVFDNPIQTAFTNWLADPRAPNDGLDRMMAALFVANEFGPGKLGHWDDAYGEYSGYIVEFEPEILGDTNNDGIIDIIDLNTVRNRFGRTGNPVLGDTDHDGDVDIDDLNNVRNNFGIELRPEETAVPEPSTSTLATLMLLVVSVWRKRP